MSCALPDDYNSDVTVSDADASAVAVAYTSVKNDSISILKSKSQSVPGADPADWCSESSEDGLKTWHDVITL